MTSWARSDEPELQRRLEEALATVGSCGPGWDSDSRLASFAGQVTHDLKTPLTTMSLSLELIRDELEDGASAEDVIPLIHRALGGSARMTTMIEDILTFARLGTSIDPVPVDLAKVAAAVVADLAGDLDGVGPDGRGPADRPGDEAQLAQPVAEPVEQRGRSSGPPTVRRR